MLVLVMFAWIRTDVNWNTFPYCTVQYLHPPATFKAYYLRRTFSILIKEPAGEGKPSLKEFWKSYNILNGVENIDASWEEVTLQSMNGVWCHAWPDAAHSFVGFDAVPGLEQAIVKLAKYVSFKKVEEEDVQELLESQAEQLTNELIELDQQWVSEESKDDDDNDDDVGQEARSLMTKNLSHFSGLLDEMTEIIQSSDPSCE
nr:tigger transposable element-derived protein 1-like [Caretta caretta]XP_048704975.1 tigger transposable element-derived protein 1-like [Caretta caretta]